MVSEFKIFLDSLQLKENITAALSVCKEQVDVLLNTHLQGLHSKQKIHYRVAESRNDSLASEKINNAISINKNSSKSEEEDEVIECGAIFYKAQRMDPVVP